MAIKDELLKAALQPQNRFNPNRARYSQYRITTAEAPENLGQSQDKPETKLGQTQDKPRTKPRTKTLNLGQSQDKVKSELRTDHRTNLGQTQDKPRTKIGFLSLVGKQRDITLFIYDSCKLTRDRTTPPISIESLSESCKTTILSAQKTTQRLEKKEIIIRVNFKNGRGGWTQYSIPDDIYQEILHNENSEKLRTNLGQTQDKVKPELRTELRTTVPSSSSYINKTTTTEFLPEWNEIDITPYKKFGFSETHVKQLAALNHITSAELELSLVEFLYDFDNKTLPPIKTSPLNYFIGIVRKGAYISATYQTTLQAELKLHADRATKRKQDELKNRTILWAETLPKSEINSFLSPARMIDYQIHGFSDPVIAELITHYVKIENHDRQK